MLRSIMARVSLPVLLSVAVPVFSGCSSEPAPGNQESNTGTLSMPLITTVNDHVYRLRASIEIYGDRYSDYIYTSDETALTRSLPAGEYVAYLVSYELDRLDEESGEWTPVSAQLVSNYYQVFTIQHQTTTTIAFAFQTDGVIVTVGTGQLVIDVDITEVPPVCTILGDDCEEDGTWCAPPELTGRPLACVYAGESEPGTACTSPQECAANSSCFDFGSGAVCAALCTPDEFGEACADDGGTCTEAGTAYGVCVPEGGTLPDYGTGGTSGAGGSAGSGGFAGFGASPGTGGFAGAGGSFPGTGGMGGFGASN
jgi:hypothetical protein